MFKFERLEVWKKSIAIYEKICELSKVIDQREQFSLGEQIRKAALSISTNIAEGTGVISRPPIMRPYIKSVTK